MTHRCAKLDAVLESPHVVLITELDHMQVVRLLHTLHPLIGLTLWVNHQRPSSGVCYNDSYKIPPFSDKRRKE